MLLYNSSTDSKNTHFTVACGGTHPWCAAERALSLGNAVLYRHTSITSLLISRCHDHMDWLEELCVNFVWRGIKGVILC